MSGQSWTFEAWIKPSNLSIAGDNSIIGQCEALSSDQCLYLVVRNRSLYMGFFGDDLIGGTTLVATNWYHVAYVFDSANVAQRVYFNGVQDASRVTTSAYRGNSGILMIGTTSIFMTSNNMFNGWIDNLYFINRMKSASEILDDATLLFTSHSIVDRFTIVVICASMRISTVRRVLSLVESVTLYSLNLLSTLI